jgi:hypothetical protein
VGSEGMSVDCDLASTGDSECDLGRKVQCVDTIP